MHISAIIAREKKSEQRSLGAQVLLRRARQQQETRRRRLSLGEVLRHRQERSCPAPANPLRWRKPVVLALVGLMLLTTTGMAAGSGLFVDKKTITLRHQSVESCRVSYADTVGEFLMQQGIYLTDGDELLPSANAPLTDGMTVQVDQRMTVILQYRGRQQRVELNRGTVADALTAGGITLDVEDGVFPTPETLLTDGMTVVVTTYDTSVITKTETVPYDTVEVADNTLYQGVRKVFRNGREGTLEREITVRYQDGLEIDRVATDERMLVRPVNEIILVGTMPQSTPTPSPTPTPAPKAAKTAAAKASKAVKATPTAIPGLNVTYEKTLTCEITAYTHTGEQTAIGTWPKATRTYDNPGTVAVAPQTIPYHTLLYVPGYGYCVAEDTGAFRDVRPYQIDLFMDTEEECQAWGRRRNKTVYIVQYNYKRK